MRELNSRFCSGIWGHNFQVQGCRRYQKSFQWCGSIPALSFLVAL